MDVTERNGRATARRAAARAHPVRPLGRRMLSAVGTCVIASLLAAGAAWAMQGTPSHRDGSLSRPGVSLIVAVDGQRIESTTTAQTVGEALEAAGVTLGTHDQVNVPMSTPLSDGFTIEVHRVTRTSTVVAEPVPYDVIQQESPGLSQGRTRVVQAGSDGTRMAAYLVDTVDGVEVSRELVAATTVTAPVTEVIDVGTRQPPASISGLPIPELGTGEARSIALGMLRDRGLGDDEFVCLDNLWTKESHWRVDAANPSGAYGIPQALPGSKMSSVGADWRTNPATQITWGLGYIEGRYGTPCDAWDFFTVKNWY